MSNHTFDPQKKIGWRYLFFIVILLLMFGYLFYGLVRLQLVNHEEYAEKAQPPQSLLKPLRFRRWLRLIRLPRYQLKHPRNLLQKHPPFRPTPTFIFPVFRWRM